MPDLMTALDTIKVNFEATPNQYCYMSPVFISHTRETRSLSVFNDLDLTEDEWDNLPFHIMTMKGRPIESTIEIFFKVDRITGIVATNDIREPLVLFFYYGRVHLGKG